MSHVAKIELNIKNIDVLKKVVKQHFNAELKKQNTYKWWGHWVGDYPLPDGFTKEDLGKCDYAISHPNCEWEIGVVKNKNGIGFTLMYDFYGHKGQQLHSVFGENLGKLRQRYTIDNIKAECVKRKQKVIERKIERKVV